ncbi:MAG: RsmB/NOP family class I SAM-dependent RNA methyltransferase [Paludibacterium sp.]|uniref:RsmB/NOP family class I SAM-dependent RNA methyltransferase n=1 Tax=Paludibacterium sp. TaxID=1917523 RepID=UPI0025F1854A|nr:RsmB/NOP family class I SAM-dependent RNA methyltransferase [Paludibacterium sp.]MBV8047339.1 RsmB/NOP family class I SAM-dependent RNA methyltransferase [Paludibacterium sp.]MBV8646651.1 RsmB/NOP family class I SAM-dependent RNA methyltransferase [Paludibacterium sp.]
MHAAQLGHIENVIGQMLRFDRPADAVLSNYFHQNNKLGAQDRHLIAETAFACLRRLSQLKALIEPDRITARRLALATLARVRGLNLKEFGDSLKNSESDWLSTFKGRVLPDDLAIQAELPQWIIDRLEDPTPESVLALGRAMMQSAPLDLRVNTLKMKRDEALCRLDEAGIKAVATPYSPIGIRVEGKPALNRLELFKSGAIEVQDEGSQILGLMVGARRGEMVADFCAGAGGKTLLLGAQMASSGRLYAFDVSEKRLANLKPRLARSGLSNVHPQLIASENDTRIKRLAGKIDRVLVDAPCSGLGTLRRNPDLKFRQSPETVEALNQQQLSILQSASRLVRDGGRLIYATCSLLPQENRGIVDAFLATHPEYRIVPAGELLSELKIPLSMSETLSINPAQHNMDGFFAIVLAKGDK